MERKRLFIAIPLPVNLKEFLVEKCREYALPGKLTPKENLHITVHFLGETDNDDIPDIEKQIADIAHDTPAFSLETDTIVLKKGRFDRMLWARITPAEPFTGLVKSIRTRLDPGKSDANVSPHITLSRVKDAKQVRADQFPVHFDPKMIDVDRIELWQSKPGGKNPNYFSLSVFDLSAAPLDFR